MSNKKQINVYSVYFILGIGIICIGFSAVFVKLANVPGPASAFYRTLIAVLALLPFYLFRKPNRISKLQLLLTLLAGLFFALDIALWNTSLLITSAASATFLGNTSPLWVGLSAVIIFREKLSLRFWIGLISALFGMAFLVEADAIGSQYNNGTFLALGAGILYAAYLITTQRVRFKVDTLSFMTLSVVSCATVLFIINLILDIPLTGYSKNSWLALLGLGLISHLGGWLSINYALGHLRAAPASVTLLGQAVVTAIVSIPILGEYLSMYQIIGGVFILGGIYFANKISK